MKEGVSSHDQIVEAATRRFTHFGIAKTTLTEVADDLGLTKQALYYHFHDKQSLIRAVIEKLTGEYLQALQLEMESAATVASGLLMLTEVKAQFFQKHFRLILQQEHSDLTSADDSWRKELEEKEIRLIASLLEKGRQSGEISAIDVKTHSRLLLDTLFAFSRCVKEKGQLPTTSDFREIFERQKEVILLFYKGLKWKA